MAYTSSLYTIEQIAYKALHYADQEEGMYRRYLQLAFDGLRELYRGVIKEGIVFSKEVPDDINRIDFPQDMEEFIGIGVPRNGKLWFLTEEDKIIATYSTEDEAQVLDADDGEGVNLATAQYETFRSTGGINIHGYFKIDWTARQIIINANERGEFVLAYVTSGISTDGITYVPTRAANALIAWILWKDALGRLKTPQEIPIVEARKIEWLEEKMTLKKRELCSVQEFRDTWNRSNTMLRR
jgi:hypothetical protein